jgi:hypothetical protein
MEFLDHRMHDGSRLFAEIPEDLELWDQLRDHLATLEGVSVTKYLTDDVTEVWIDFDFKSHKFTVNNQFGEFWFFVADPSCGDEILEAVVVHARKFIG